jgi:ABC-type transport system involved in cytochrome bd biosynthesis fused ATPase/permease subunit
MSTRPDRLSPSFSWDAGALKRVCGCGNRQRIALARAFLKDVPIVISDEATSARLIEELRRITA